MIKNNIIVINYNNKLYKIEKEPYETIIDTYKRGWYIVKNYGTMEYKKLYSLSIIKNNENNYDMDYFLK